MLSMTVYKRYKILAHMITEKAKKMGTMKRYDYVHTVRPFATMFRNDPLSEQQLLSGLRRANVAIVK